MSKKIYISPSDQTKNLYAVGNTNEAEQCRRIALALVDALGRCGFAAKTNVSPSASMYDRVKESNAWGANAHIAVHTNAYNGKVTGFRGFFYSAGGIGHQLVTAILNAVAPITPGTSDGISANPKLYEVKSSNAPCAYLELGFHDNKEEARFIIDNTQELAEAVCKGICDHYGVTYVNPYAEANTPDTAPENPGIIYRVQVGAFRDKANAEALLKKLHDLGFADAFIK